MFATRDRTIFNAPNSMQCLIFFLVDTSCSSAQPGYGTEVHLIPLALRSCHSNTNFVFHKPGPEIGGSGHHLSSRGVPLVSIVAHAYPGADKCVRVTIHGSEVK